MKISQFIIPSLLISNLSLAATSGINPSTLKLKIYKVAVSTSKLCTSPTVIFNESNPSYSDFLANPTLGSGSIAAGTYPCVIMEFSSSILPTPAATSDNNVCVAGTEFTLNVCSAGQTSTLIDGTTTTCTGSNDRIAMYLSTASTETSGTQGHTAFQPPTSDSDATHGFKLSSALVVSASASGTFVVNGSGKIKEQNNNGTLSCEFQPPLFSFR